MPERSPLMLIHGFTDTADTWRPLIPRLEPHHDLVVPMLAGHGGRRLPTPMERPAKLYVDDLERQLDAAGHERAHLVGNSLGGWLAFELAARGRARSVVALSPANGWDADKPPRSVTRHFALQSVMLPVGLRFARGLASRPGTRKVALGDIVAHPERLSPDTALRLIEGAGECAIFWAHARDALGRDYRTALAPFDVPVRIAWGDNDRTLPYKSCTDWHRSAWPDAEWVRLHDCGHLPHHDDPDLVAQTVLEHTQRVDAGVPAGVS